MQKKSVWLAICVFVLSSWVYASDLYVKAGSEGNGTKESPYGDLWKALEKALRGDVIHMAEGVYNGKGGCGAFTIKIPNLTIVGGYKGDFSERNPFKYLTILERAKDYKGDWTGLPEGIIAGVSDHSGLIVDGLVLNGESRNAYQKSGDINITKSYKGCGFQANSPNIKIRNCIIINPLGDGIYCAWGGKENEIANTFILNTFYNSIATRSAQPDSEVQIKNCTVAFCWFYPTKGGGMSVFVGRQGKTVMENNVFALNQTEGGEAGFGVSNTFGNEDTVLKNNIFYQCQGGYYKYMDADKKSLLAWKSEDLKGMNDEAGSYMLAESGGNSDEDPQFMPDKDFFEKFSNFIASQPGKLNMDFLNKWRQSVGLPLQAEPSSVRKNYGMAYPLKAVVPNLISKVAQRGVQADGPFATYKSEAKAPESKEYVETAFANFGKDKAKTYTGQMVTFKAGMGASATSWLLKNAERANYDCVKLNMPGESQSTIKCVYGYMLKGSAAAKNWAKYLKKKDKYAKAGLIIKGTIWYAGADTYAYPVCVIVEEVLEK